MDYIYINKGGGGIFRKGRLGPIGQGTAGIDLVIQALDLDKSAIDLTGFTTITGRMEKQDTGAVTAIDGTLTLVSSGAGGQLTWVVSANDSGTDGLFDVVFNLTNGTDTYVTLPAELMVTNNPSVTSSANNLLVGVIQAVADFITGIFTDASTATTGQVLTADGAGSATFEDPAAAASVAINDITDVTITTPADKELLSYDNGSSEWINQTAAEAGLSEAGHTHSYLANVVEDTTPQLGGNLDLNGNVITGLEIGTDVQAYSAKTAAIAALTWAANNIILLTGTATASVQALAAHVVTFLQSATAGDARAAIGAAAASDLSTHEGLTTTAHGGVAPLRPVDRDIAGTTHMLELTDESKSVRSQSGSATTFTVPLNSSIAFPTGTIIGVAQKGTGELSIAATGGVTINSLNSNLKLAGQHAEAALRKTDTNVWDLIGALKA